MKKIWFYGGVMALLFLWVFPALASTTSQALTAQGRTFLFNNGSPTVPGLQQAVGKFKSAIQADPNDREARFFSAVSNILLSVTQNSGNTVITTLADLAKSFGVNRNTNISLLSSPYDKPPMLRDEYNPPANIPDGSKLQTFLAGPFLDLLTASLADLSVIDSQEKVSPFKLTLTAGELDALSPVEVDYGDVLLLEAGLRTMKAVILITDAYDMKCSLRDIIVLNNAGIFQIERDLAEKYPDLMNLKPNGTGAAELTKARTELIKLIDNSRAAMDFIKNKRGTQGNYLFTFANQSEMNDAQLNIDGMTEVENSLKENRPAILSRTESFDLHLKNGGTPRFYVQTNVDGKVNNASDIWFSAGGVDNTYLHVNTSSYSKTSTALKVTVAGGAYEWEQNQFEQWCNVSSTVNAVLSGNNITSGSIAVTDSCKGNSSFSITSGSVTTISDNEIDLNRLFGNTGKPPLDIRHYLPHYDARGETINDGNLPTPAFGGIFPGGSYQDSVSLVSPVPFKIITVDGNDADWQGINNIVNTSNRNFQSPDYNFQSPDYVKIKDVKSSRDNNYIYVMVRTAATDTTKPLTVDASFYYGNNNQYLELSYDGNGTTNCALGDANGIYSTDTSNCKLVNNVAELRLPIDKISDYSNARLYVSTSSSSSSNSYYDDYFTASILLSAHKDTGTLTCAANNGHGRIFIVAYDGPAMISKAFLGSVIMQSPGNFTVPLFARTANTYLYGWWDADNNGILSLGDYVGHIGPLTTTQNIALNLNRRLMVDFTKVILPSNSQAGGSLSFSAAKVTSTDSGIISYEWNFGDNTTATGAEVNHTYQRAGDYQLTLKVKTKSGETDSRSTIVHVAEAAYKIDGAISGLASGKSINLYAYSASTGSYGFQSINGDGSSPLNYSITNLPPAPDYTLFINSADYPGGYYDGNGGLTNASQAASIDLSASDKQNVDFTLPSAKTLTVQLDGVKAGDQIKVRAWSQSLGLMSEQTVTANGTSVTAIMDNLQAQGNYVVYIRPVVGNSCRDGYYQGENLQPGSLSQALALPMTDNTAINITMGNGYKITGTITGLAKGEIATVSAWSPGYRNGNAALITGTGSDIRYTISGLPSRPDYMVAIKVLGGGGGYYGGASQPLATYQNALPLTLNDNNLGGINLTLPQGHTISGKITGTGGGYAVVYAWSPSSGNYASTGITLPGTYSFTNMPPASDYKVGVYVRNYLNPTPLIVDISQHNQVDQDFTLTRGGAIIGTITVPSGTDNLRLMVCSAEHETCASLNLHAPLSGGDVNYFVPGLPAANDLILSLHLGNTVYFYDSINNGSSSLTSDPGLAMSEALTLAPGQVLTGINMDLSSLYTFSLTGKVQGVLNSDKDIAVVITVWNNQGGRGSVVRNGNGTFSIPGLPAGKYYLMATAAGYSNMFYNGKSWGIGLGKAKLFSVTANTNINDLTLNKGYTVSGTLTDPDHTPLAGVYISAWDADQKFGGGAVSLGDGSFKISGLPAGTYSLEIHCLAGDYEGSINQLSADTTRNITVNKEAGVISGSVTGSGRNNAIIFVYDNQGHYVTAVVPSADGSGSYTYKIDNLPATGTYRIKVDTDGNYSTMEWTGSVTLSSATASQILNIGL